MRVCPTLVFFDLERFAIAHTGQYQERGRLIAPQKKVRNYIELCYYQRRNTALCQKLLI
jgi:hypothetical protein